MRMARQVGANQHDPVGLVKWQRREQDPLHDGEHRRRRADPEGHHDDGRRRERGIAPEDPTRETEIVQEQHAVA